MIGATTKQTAGKQGKRISGIGRDAALLGVSRQHLWRVETGKIVSRSLSERYAALKAGKPISDANQSPNCSGESLGIDREDVNLNWRWIKDVLGKLGVSVLVVTSKTNPQEAGWPHIGHLIGRQLESRQLGCWDSAKRGKSTCWWFYVSSNRLAEALPVIKGELEVVGVLSEVKIGVADASGRLFRVFHPEWGKPSA